MMEDVPRVSKGPRGRISGFDQERKLLSQGDRLALACTGEDACSVYSQQVLQPPVSARVVRTLPFPARDTAQALPAEAVGTAVIGDNWQPPGSAGDVPFVLVVLGGGLGPGVPYSLHCWFAGVPGLS